MYKVEFDIKHEGCWGSEISERFPDVRFSLIDTRWVKGEIAEILLVKGGKHREVIDYLKKRKDNVSVEVVSQDKENLFLRVITKNIKKLQHFSHIFYEHSCFPVAPCRLEDGYEKWILGTTDKKNISVVYSKIKHETKIRYIKQDSINASLTNKQQEIMNYAIMFGYYEWPRKKTATEICRILKIPKTVFLSHLRKAENKIIKQSISRP